MNINVEDFLDIPLGGNTAELIGGCCREPSIVHREDGDLWMGSTWIAIPRGIPSNRTLDIVELLVFTKELADLMATQCGYKARVRARGRLVSLYLNPGYSVTKQSQIPTIYCKEFEVLSAVPAKPMSFSSRPKHNEQQPEPSAASPQPQAAQPEADRGAGSSTVTIAGRTFQVFNP